MTTSRSPIEAIRTQAITVAARLKSGGIKSKGTESITFAIVQDDKVIKITWRWGYIYNASHQELIEAIMQEMTR